MPVCGHGVARHIATEREGKTVCAYNHPPAIMAMLATPELGHRLISYNNEIGLSPERLKQVVDTSP